MIVDGFSDTEIEKFMFDRYGDFIFYRPRLRAETILLWFGPIMFLLIGGYLALGIWRRASLSSVDSTSLDSEQAAQLQKLLRSKH
jgi:cytochrome c-type biogenesis protein CcmH